MGRWVVLTALAASLIGMASPSLAAATDERRCGLRGARPIAGNLQVTVVRRAGSTFACRASGRGRVPLGDFRSTLADTSVSSLRIEGYKIAYGLPQARATIARYSIRVIDLRTGQRRAYYATAPRATPTASPEEQAREGVYDLVLAPDGSVAWIAYDAYATTPTYQLWAAPVTTAPRLVDTGSGISPSSLSLSENTLYWTNLEPRAVTLTP